jgi:hypothetical protein
MDLKGLLAREQRAYLRRDRRGWEDHLVRARAFLGEGLRQADPDRPVLILGAGTGLEVPWSLAPPHATGWDADPWSRLGTALRHRRWPAWVFDDFTGGFAELEATLRRCLNLPGSFQRRPAERATRRLAGLLPSLKPDAAPLRLWIDQHRPGTILVANVLGQLGSVAERMVETAFQPVTPWIPDPELPDPLVEALDAWNARALQAISEALLASGADLWMIHDRAIVHGTVHVDLGPLESSWIQQLRGTTSLEVGDPLPGLDVLAFFNDRPRLAFDRWLWPVGEDQLHLMEALAVGSSARHATTGIQTV